jgi:hypothetical protein
MMMLAKMYLHQTVCLREAQNMLRLNKFLRKLSNNGSIRIKKNSRDRECRKIRIIIIYSIS